MTPCVVNEILVILVVGTDIVTLWRRLVIAPVKKIYVFLAFISADIYQR